MNMRIIGRKEDEKGLSTHYRLTDGSIITSKLAVLMLKKGLLKGYHIFKLKDVEYIRDNPDSKVDDNIDEQPLIISVNINTSTGMETL